MADLSGHTLGKYQLVERLGRGGMADVYKGYHPRLERYVAVKTLHSQLIEASPDFLPRFEREAKAVATLRHPHIVQVYDFDLQGEIYFMVMELVDGISLGEMLFQLAQKKERLPYQRILELLQEIGAALDYAHQNHMLHRDIKPSNVLLDKTGHAFLADFGIARILGSSTHFTSTGTLIGTPQYMSPEQGKGEELTTASDVYALGVVLYEMLVGRVPFDAETPYGIIHKHINESLPPARSLRSDLPAAVEAVLNKALAKAPQDRFQAAGELVAAFQQALAMKPASGIPAGPVEQSPVPRAQVERPQAVAASFQAAAPMPEPARYEPAVAQPGSSSTPAASSVPVSHGEAVQLAAEAPQMKKKSSCLWVVLLVLFLLGGLVVIGYFALDSFQQELVTQGCDTPEACLDRANQLVATGKPGLALPSLNEAIDLVPENNHPPYARLVCRRGDVYLMLERNELAARDFALCIEWIENDRDQEDLRNYAKEKLRGLK
ncbi:MAG: hypothetical protein A2Z16_00040 [Chloroflexi bacterium RBG_16_54_18]|nr:MAG: hypothetical protein A2Z16_00040 [Chloroflexi bacterium RBG_16_54_18]